MKLILTLAVLCMQFMLIADIKLPSIFSDHAVLQRSNATAIFGTAAPGEKVTVNFGDISAETVAGKDGRFLVKLDLSKAGNEAGELIVTGKNKIVIKDVIVGEVWFCTGQSNMALTVYRVMNAGKVIKNSANDKIRMFSIPRNTSTVKKDDTAGQWLIASPKNTGIFTAVGLFFAQQLNRETGLPVGLINSSWGGSHIESWICKEHLDQTPGEVKKLADKDLDMFINYESYRNKFIEKLQSWERSLGWIDDKKSIAPPAGAKWMKAPPLTSNFPNPGVVWFRKDIELTPADILPDGTVAVQIRKVMVATDFYWDGKVVHSVSRHRSVENHPIRFRIPTKPGKHTMMMRVSATENVFHFPGEHLIGKQNNATGWEYCREKYFPKGDRAKIAARPGFIATRPYAIQAPSQLYNNMVHPFIRYTAKGALWYQGESNAGPYKGRFYDEHLTALIKCLREGSGNPEFRFYAVQLPCYMAKQRDPGITGFWPEIRENQTRALKQFSHTAEIILIDTGEAKDIHPIDKQPAGSRLAAVALYRDYGKKDVLCSYPEAVSAVRNGNAVTVKFTNCSNGLAAKKLPETYWLNRTNNQKAALIPNSPGSLLEGFALCGSDGKWFWANAEIKGDTVTVTSDKVAIPVKVRYAYQNNPTCNLFNAGGLPASPFTLDVE